MGLEIKINILDNGALAVSGPDQALDDRLFMYGMFEMAKDAIRERAAKKSNLIQVPSVQLPPNGNR